MVLYYNFVKAKNICQPYSCGSFQIFTFPFGFTLRTYHQSPEFAV